MFQRGWFLIDVSEEHLAAELVEVVQRYGVARALRADERDRGGGLLTEPGRVAGIIVEARGPNESFLQGLREACPSTPMLALCQPSEDLRAQWQLINTAQRLGIEVAHLPVQVPNVVSFVQRALSAAFLPHEGVARVVSELARARGLTAREVQILTYCLGNETRKRVRRRLGIAENTLKTQVRSLLRKCDERSVDALAKNVLRAALYEGRACRVPVTSWRGVPSMELAESA